MRKVIIGAALLALSSQAGAITLTLTAYNQRSSSGTLSTMKWDGCAIYSTATACINPANTNISAMGITPSVMTWHWNEGTGVLTMTGTFNSVSTLGSSGSAVASTVNGDKVTNMTINTTAGTTTAGSYSCAEGNFLAGVGANGCLNISLGDDGLLQSSGLYNVGGNANCVQRTIGGDDLSTGNPRGLMSAAAAGGCNAVDGAFNLWTVVTDTTNLGIGGQLRVSNGIPITNAGTSYLTFTVSAVPVPGAVWLLGSAVGLLGLVRRRIAA
ncbi:MAG: VPLPA-CTERM sorting domain-containing protein [Gammaproteobacteria bacterium]